jgi:hypothetical protein
MTVGYSRHTCKTATAAFSDRRAVGRGPAAHQVYGLAVATADFRAIAEALSDLYLLYVFRGADFALLIPELAEQFNELGSQMFRDRPPDTEARFSAHVDPLKLPATTPVALKLCELAEDASRNADGGRASFFYQAATVCALRAADEDDPARCELVSHIASDWASFRPASETTSGRWPTTSSPLSSDASWPPGSLLVTPTG